METCQAISKYLLPKYVNIPQGNRLKEVVDGFELCWGVPQAAGAIDGSHIPIVHPQESASNYYNRKSYYSVIMQGLVDFCGLCMDIYVGWPGKVHDARVFVNSSLYLKGMSNNRTGKGCSLELRYCLAWLSLQVVDSHTPIHYIM